MNVADPINTIDTSLTRAFISFLDIIHDRGRSSERDHLNGRAVVKDLTRTEYFYLFTFYT